jgi:hypothetical protein
MKMGRMTTQQRADAERNTASVAEALEQVKRDLGNVSIYEISRMSLYRRIADKTGISVKSVAYKLNHVL